MSELDLLKQSGYSLISIYINQDGTALRFETDLYFYIYRTRGECCAAIYFEDIEYPSVKPEHGYGVKDIRSINEYGYRIVTDVGDIVISGRYDDGSGWGGYAVDCYLYAVIPKDFDDYKASVEWSEFKENKEAE